MSDLPTIPTEEGFEKLPELPARPSGLERFVERFVQFFGGFKVTAEQMVKPRVTWQYPEEKRPKPPRAHGRHVLNRYEDGLEKCIGCELCAGVCPADCIYVRGADNPEDDPVSPGERYGYVYEINYLRCIHCDLCVEACPTEAITESKMFEFSFTNRQDAIYTKAELVVDDEGRPRPQPWEDWREGEDAHTSAWMRATSPAGNKDYEGVVQWSGELGYGTRAPEGGQSDNRDDEATGNLSLLELVPEHFGIRRRPAIRMGGLVKPHREPLGGTTVSRGGVRQVARPGALGAGNAQEAKGA
jgi:NADH-quinone oxidoreductase subunit I